MPHPQSEPLPLPNKRVKSPIKDPLGEREPDERGTRPRDTEYDSEEGDSAERQRDPKVEETTPSRRLMKRG